MEAGCGLPQATPVARSSNLPCPLNETPARRSSADGAPSARRGTAKAVGRTLDLDNASTPIGIGAGHRAGLKNLAMDLVGSRCDRSKGIAHTFGR